MMLILLSQLKLMLPINLSSLHPTPEGISDSAYQACRKAWEKHGLFIFYLLYSHFNLIEVFWRKLKYEWLRP